MYETCKYIGEVGYYNKIVDAIVSTCQSVRLGKMNATQGAKAIQTLAEAQYKQYTERSLESVTGVEHVQLAHGATMARQGAP